MPQFQGKGYEGARGNSQSDGGIARVAFTERRKDLNC